MKIYRRFHLALILALATTALLVSAVIAKTELVTNGTFDTDTNDWYNLPSIVGSISYTDSQGHTAIGAADVRNLSTSTGTTSNGGAQCIDLPTPVADYYTVEGWVKVPNQSNTDAEAYVRFAFYPNTGCSDGQLKTADTNEVLVGSDWTKVNATSSTASGAESVQVRLYVRKTGSTSAYAYFDDISFFPSTAADVALSSLTVRSELPAVEPEGVLNFRSFVVAPVGVAIVAAGASVAALRRWPVV